MSEVYARAVRLKYLRDEIKSLKEEEDRLRDEFVQEGVAEWEDRESLLPTRTISVPDEFWLRTPFISANGFVASRFPTWDLVSSQRDPELAETIIVMRKKPEYMLFTYEDELVKVSKSPVEATPSIDEETLKMEKPELFEKLFKPVTRYELDEEALGEAIQEDPEIPSVLMRHQYTTRAPSQRISVSEKKK